MYSLKEKAEFDLVHSDFLALQGATNRIPSAIKGSSDEDCEMVDDAEETRGFDAVFLSPPWGGTGYLQLEEYSLDHIFPDFDDIIEKATQYSGNLSLFLPKNTSIEELI